MILLLVQMYDFFIIYEVKNSAFYEDKTDTNCADVVSLGGAPKLSPQRRIRRDACRGEQFGEGEREPDAAVAEHLRQQDEAGHEEDSTAQQREHHCRAHAFNALEVADAHEVDDEEHEGDSQCRRLPRRVRRRCRRWRTWRRC